MRAIENGKEKAKAKKKIVLGEKGVFWGQVSGKENIEVASVFCVHGVVSMWSDLRSNYGLMFIYYIVAGSKLDN